MMYGYPHLNNEQLINNWTGTAKDLAALSGCSVKYAYEVLSLTNWSRRNELARYYRKVRSIAAYKNGMSIPDIADCQELSRSLVYTWIRDEEKRQWQRRLKTR